MVNDIESLDMEFRVLSVFLFLEFFVEDFISEVDFFDDFVVF